MPGNIVKINNSDELSFYVGDSEIEKLLKYLNKVGMRMAGYRFNKKARNERKERTDRIY